MRRWVFSFLLLVVPLQLVWGAAAPYCAHEASISAKDHFGHHEHEHQSGGEIASAATDDVGGIAGAFHDDCETCHLGCSAFMLAVNSAVQALPHVDAMRHPEAHYDSHIPAGPLRPDRAPRTPAARSCGDVVVVPATD